MNKQKKKNPDMTGDKTKWQLNVILQQSYLYSQTDFTSAQEARLETTEPGFHIIIRKGVLKKPKRTELPKSPFPSPILSNTVGRRLPPACMCIGVEGGI